MSLKDAVSSAFKNYANFKGRARRSEYWYFSLFNFIVIVVALSVGVLIDNATQSITGIGGIIIVIYTIAIIIPNLSVTCRRLHDVGKSGAYVFFYLIPIVGKILIWVWLIQDGQPWANQYGEDPKGREMNPFGTGHPSSYAAEPMSFAQAGTPKSVVAKKKCTNCGADIDADAVFCSSCGQDTRIRNSKLTTDTVTPTKPTTICNRCGRTIYIGTSFCPFCGENPNKPKHETWSVTGESRTNGLTAPTDLD